MIQILKTTLCFQKINIFADIPRKPTDARISCQKSQRTAPKEREMSDKVLKITNKKSMKIGT